MTQLEGWLYMSHIPCAASSTGTSALPSLRFPLTAKIARLSLPFHFKNTQIIVAYTLHLVRRGVLAHCSTAPCSDLRTPGHWDMKARGHGDMKTWGHEGMGTWGQGVLYSLQMGLGQMETESDPGLTQPLLLWCPEHYK